MTKKTGWNGKKTGWNDEESWLVFQIGRNVKKNKNIFLMKQPAVYILASQRNGTLYTGVTSNIVKRVWEHKHNLVDGFTQKYNVHMLVFFELHDDIYSAITREKKIKKWRREWKLALIEESNSEWEDLWDTIVS